MVNLNCLPSEFLLARTPPGQIIAEIEENFGFTSAVRDPFEDILDDLTGQLLSDPFKLTVGDSFGLSVGDSGNNRNETIFEGWYGNLHADRTRAEPTDSASAVPKKKGNEMLTSIHLSLVIVVNQTGTGNFSVPKYATGRMYFHHVTVMGNFAVFSGCR